VKRRYFFYTVLFLLLSGCIPKTEILHLYSLKVESSFTAPQKSNSTLKVDYPTALNGLSGSRIYYNDNSKVGYYLYSRWESSLNRMLYSITLTNLQKRGSYKYVIGYNSSAQADYELELEIDSFEHIIKGNNSFAQIELNVRLIESQTTRVVKQKTFHYQIPLENKNAKAFVKGARKAMEEFIEELIQFLA